MMKLDFCKVVLEPEPDSSNLYFGVVRYRWGGNSVTGSDMIKEIGSLWSDDDVREHVAAIVGIEHVDIERIQVEWI